MFRGSVGGEGITGVSGIVARGWYVRGCMCGMAAGVGVAWVADADARLLLLLVQPRREVMRGGKVEDVDQLVIFFWKDVCGGGMNGKRKWEKRRRGHFTSSPLWCWSHIGLILGSTGSMRELVDGLAQLAVLHGAELEG